jgi:hypothetical protein
VKFPKIVAFPPKTSARNGRFPKMGAQNNQGLSSVDMRKRSFVPYCVIVRGIRGLAIAYPGRQTSLTGAPFLQIHPIAIVFGNYCNRLREMTTGSLREDQAAGESLATLAEMAMMVCGFSSLARSRAEMLPVLWHPAPRYSAAGGASGGVLFSLPFRRVAGR